MSIDLHIERVVIDAALLGSEPPRRLQDAIECELTRLLAQAAPDGFVGASEAFRQAEMPSASGSLGSRIAASIHRALAPVVDRTDVTR